MNIVWIGGSTPPAGLEITKVTSLSHVDVNALVFIDEQAVVQWEDIAQRRAYIVSDLPISAPLPTQIAGVIPNDRMVIEAICMFYKEMSASYELGDKLIKSLNEKERTIQEKQSILLRDSRRYSAIIRHATDMIVVLGPSGKIMFSNDTLRRYLKADDLTGRSIVDLVVDADRGEIEALIDKGFKEGSPSKAECRLELDEGRLGIFSLMSTPLREDGHIYALSVIGRDITDLRTMQRRLMAQAKDLSSMINGLSHELRNPLTVIGAYIKRLDRGTPKGQESKRREAVNSILASITRIEDMVTRIERYKGIASMETCFTEVALSTFVHDLLRSMNIDLPHSVTGENEVRVYTSPDHLRIALARLLENAVESGSERIEVAISCRDRQAAIGVRDYGCGVKDDIETIFSPFFSTDPMKVGLGLTEARIALVKIAGEIDVTPQASPGANFTIRIPLDRRWRERGATAGESG